MRRVVAHVGSLADAARGRHRRAALLARSLIERDPPEHGAEPGSSSTFCSTRRAASFNTTGPGYLAYIPGGGLLRGGSRTSSRTRSTASRASGCPRRLLVQLEAERHALALRHRRLPRGRRRVPHDGRLARELERASSRRGTRSCPRIFLRRARSTSRTRRHHSVRKAARLAGFPDENVRDDARRTTAFRMRPTRCRAPRGGPGGRPAAVPRRRERGDDEHGRRRRLPALADIAAQRGPVAPRRRRVRRLLRR